MYEPSAERIAEIAKAQAEEDTPLNLHYDASREVRAKGAGFYQFSGDEETRRAQMDELKAVRDETEKVRKESGAVDIKPGMEGMQADGSNALAGKSKAMEKRKREIEERRRLLDAKRRKVEGKAAVDEPTVSADPFAALETQGAVKDKQSDADAFLAQLESEIFKGKAR